MIRLNWQYAFNKQSEVGMSEKDFQQQLQTAMAQVRKLNAEEGDCEDKGIKMLGWQKFAAEIDEKEIARIEKLGAKLREKAEVIWLIGIGGSYLGARSVIESQLGKDFNTVLRAEGVPEIYFMGADTDPVWLDFVLRQSQGKKVGLVAISKSGTTLEPALALRCGLSLIEEEADLAERVIAITDARKGALKELAERTGWETLVVPDDIGGRYSVITPVGLLPMVIAGLDIREYLAGVREGMKVADSEDDEANLAAKLAAWRYALAQKVPTGATEYQVTNSQAMEASLNWVMQLEPESEGHGGHGAHVISALFPRDLHSFGQLIQQGPRNLYEIATRVRSEMVWAVPKSKLIGNLDGLAEMADEMSGTESGSEKTEKAGKKIEAINEAVIDGALAAHYNEGGVSALIWELPDLSLRTLGEYHYILMKATAISGYLWGHNPFVQPGVQAWKAELQKLLG